ncbi:SDR family oxidoreductase [Nonomuraea candida]|uniref:SDR family oxidoreductase n=1 Tax=Nonomuraea candida TaxID=359159 RepID=UPI000A00B66C|nr:SDR family oxidoreductase [Nonomuraea candida]
MSTFTGSTMTGGRFAGRTALVTGSSRGIGRATALRLAGEGALVAVHYASNKEAAEQTLASIERAGGSAFAVRAELGMPGDVEELFEGLEAGLRAHHGSVTLDILVNNAGVLAAGEPEEVTRAQLEHLFAVNSTAPFLIVQRALRILAEGGRIINISSGLTRIGNPAVVPYAMTKGALEQLARHLARHLAPRGITINTVAPGVTDNGGPTYADPETVAVMARQSAFNRVGQTRDIADVVAFLASEEARWITGAFVDATGGGLLG